MPAQTSTDALARAGRIIRMERDRLPETSEAYLQLDAALDLLDEGIRCIEVGE